MNDFVLRGFCQQIVGPSASPHFCNGEVEYLSEIKKWKHCYGNECLSEYSDEAICVFSGKQMRIIAEYLDNCAKKGKESIFDEYAINNFYKLDKLSPPEIFSYMIEDNPFLVAKIIKEVKK